MITLIVGKKGSGKTKKLIERASQAVKSTNGNVIVIEKGSKLTYDLPHEARLVDTDAYKVTGADAFFGFVSGICAGDYDVNMRSFGIEHADKDSDPWLIADKALDAGAHLCAAICKEYKLGRPKWGGNIFPHSDFTATACPGQLKGSQKAKYMRLAQQYYEEMTGETGGDTSSMDLGDLDWWGTKYTKALQTQLGTKVDGYLDGQSLENDDYFWAAGSGVRYNWPDWESTCIIKLQKKLDEAGYDVGSSGYDGVYGPDTIKAHQQCLIDHGYSCGECGADGYHGNVTNNAMGAALKDGFYKKKW